MKKKDIDRFVCEHADWIAHRREMNHSKKFYAEVLRVYPDYHTHHAYLKQNGSAIMKRNPKSK